MKEKKNMYRPEILTLEEISGGQNLNITKVLNFNFNFSYS